MDSPQVLARLHFFINALEADFAYILDPTKRLIQYPAEGTTPDRGKGKR